MANTANWLKQATVLDTGLARHLYEVAPATLTWWARNGRVRAEKVGHRWYYNAEDISIQLRIEDMDAEIEAEEEAWEEAQD